MDLDLLYQNIKLRCEQKGISITQLEKELHFGAGLIGKWKQSAPSIEKVMAVADYFRVSLDELCGVKKKKTEMAFMDRLIQRTVNGEIKWFPCSGGRILNNRFDLIQNYDEIYGAQYDIGRFYIGHDGNAWKFYMSLEDGQYLKQNEDIMQMQELWKSIKEKEQELQEKIDEFKRNFMDE
ncbi:MAG: helix-turn-helix domain-containing protein [Eubacterium sp.]|nr:helix-turn-helix domain-containing protein [Eubacterium sp.]